MQRLSHEHKPINISKYIIAFRCCLFVSRVIACEQALLFGRVKRVSRERPSFARSREARFACPNRRACSQASRVKDVEITFGIFRSEDCFDLNPSLNRNLSFLIALSMGFSSSYPHVYLKINELPSLLIIMAFSAYFFDVFSPTTPPSHSNRSQSSASSPSTSRGRQKNTAPAGANQRTVFTARGDATCH